MAPSAYFKGLVAHMLNEAADDSSMSDGQGEQTA